MRSRNATTTRFNNNYNRNGPKSTTTNPLLRDGLLLDRVVSKTEQNNNNNNNNNSKVVIVQSCTLITLLLIGGFGWWLMNLLSLWKTAYREAMMTETTTTTSQKVHHHRHHHPWDASSSIPPISTELFNTNHPVILQRHECIKGIRDLQISILKKLFSPSSFPVLLVDPAYHFNVGDQMITEGEHALLRNLGVWDTLLNNNNNNNNNKEEEEKGSVKKVFPINNNNGGYRECHYVQANEFVPHCDDVIFIDNDDDAAVSSSSTTKKKQALLHGGGNWGDLWPSAHKARIEQSFRALIAANYSVIVGMPQSLYYRQRETEAFEARLLKREIQPQKQQQQQQQQQRGGDGQQLLDSSNTTRRTAEGSSLSSSQVILTWREYESYVKAQKLYPFVQNILLPDIAFQLGPYQRHEPFDKKEQLDYLLLLRRDHESNLFNIPRNDDDDDDDDEDDDQQQQQEKKKKTGSEQRKNTLIADIPQAMVQSVQSAMKQVIPNNNNNNNKKKRTFRIVDWSDRLVIFNNSSSSSSNHTNNNPYYFTETAIQLISMGRVLICDRLHAAILAFLSEIPFVYIDQSTGKISKCLRVALEDKNCGIVTNRDRTTTVETLWLTNARNLTDAIMKGEELLSLLPPR